MTTTNKAERIVVVDEEFWAVVLREERGGVVVRELGTRREDWYQASRVRPLVGARS